MDNKKLDELKRIKNEQGLTYEDIAEKSGIPLSTVQKVLGGKTKAPRASTVEAIRHQNLLRTVVVREWSELGILGAIILLRGVLTFLIHWEIKNEKNEIAQNEK